MPGASRGEIASGRKGYFDAGQTFVLRVGSGTTPNATGAYTWVPITDENGAGLPGTITITDPNGVTSVDARNTTDLPAFKGTDYQRPEDLQLQTVKGVERLYVTTTTTNETYVLDLAGRRISVFADRKTTDLASGLPVGAALASPDNLAIDHEGNIYIVEDRNGGADDDIWFARDLNQDGDLIDPGEGIGRWASNGTVGSEFTGLYFDPTDKRSSVGQHPASRQRQRPHHRDHNPVGTAARSTAAGPTRRKGWGPLPSVAWSSVAAGGRRAAPTSWIPFRGTSP